MMKLSTSFMLTLLLWSVSYFSYAQETDTQIPAIPGYQTLKADLHLHTVFSDGHVWPSFRVQEALRDGMDVISLTEHIDYEGFPDEIKRDYNKAYELAKQVADQKDLIVIRGAEISPRVPPYHNNAIFLKDANKLPSKYMKNWKQTFVMKDHITEEELLEPFLEAKKQDAFVFYNHPDYNWWDKKDTAIFTSLHHKLLDMGILKGVEVVNGGRYNILAHKIAMKYDLTMFCNTDEHYDMYPKYGATHRPMTLIFSEDRTEEAIKAALLDKRTALYFGEYLIAREKEAEALFKASVSVQAEFIMRNEEPILKISLTNNSSIPFHTEVSAPYMVESLPLGQLEIPALGSASFILKALWDRPETVEVNLKVSNILVTPDDALETKFILNAH